MARAEIVAMLERAANEESCTLAQAVFEWREGSLSSPRLRDLWLIWGDVLEATS